MPPALVCPPRLSPADEQCAAYQAHAGEGTGRARLISHNLRLVWREVRRVDPTGYDADDLFGAGCEALIHAADAFRPARGFRFSTLAVPSIQHAVRREARRLRRRVPTVPLAGPDGSGLELVMPAPDNTEAAALAHLAAAALHHAVARLIPQDRALVVARYGLDGAPPLTQTVLAAHWHCTPSAVSRREARVLAHLRRVLAAWDPR